MRLPPLFLLLFTAALALTPGCSCNDTVPTRGICATLGINGCGDDCSASQTCAAGLYCDSQGVCEADCTQSGGQCDNGEMCSSDGQCVPVEITDLGMSVDLGPPQDSGGPVDMGGCVDETVMAERVVPNVVVLVDQSGSMNVDFGTNVCSGGSPPSGCGDSCSTNFDCDAGLTCTNGSCRGAPNRWDAVRDALLGERTTNTLGDRDETTGLFPTLGDRINFVLSLYTARWNDGDDNNGNDGPIPVCTDGVCDTNTTAPGDSSATCPQIVNIPSSGGLAALESAYEAETWADETPTGASVNHVVQNVVPGLPAQDTFIILATDGEPDTCAEPNPQNGQQDSLDAVTAAFTAGIPTFVIGVNINTSHFQELANVGQGLPADEPAATEAQFFSADDTTALSSALNQILRDRISCDVTLNGQVPNGAESMGTVILQTPGGNITLGLDDPNGWELVDPSTVRINGTACDTWKDGESDLDIMFPCNVIIFG